MHINSNVYNNNSMNDFIDDDYYTYISDPYSQMKYEKGLDKNSSDIKNSNNKHEDNYNNDNHNRYISENFTRKDDDDEVMYHHSVDIDEFNAGITKKNSTRSKERKRHNDSYQNMFTVETIKTEIEKLPPPSAGTKRKCMMAQVCK